MYDAAHWASLSYYVGAGAVDRDLVLFGLRTMPKEVQTHEAAVSDIEFSMLDALDLVRRLVSKNDPVVSLILSSHPLPYALFFPVARRVNVFRTIRSCIVSPRVRHLLFNIPSLSLPQCV